jgi:hypothetical protein
MTADSGTRTTDFHVRLCAPAQVVSFANDGGQRTTDGEFSFVVAWP